MSTPLKISYHILNQGTSNIGIEYRPYHYIYYPLYYTGFPSGIGIDPISPDPGAGIFANEQDALDYYIPIDVQTMIEIINNERLTDFVFDELVTGSVPDIQSKIEALEAALNDKVDKVTGKGLSTEDYTSIEKTKLAGL